MRSEAHPGSPQTATRWRLLSGVYLLLFPLPWLRYGTSLPAVAAWLAGSAILLALPFLPDRFRPSLRGQAIATAAIGLALIPFRGYWGIFFIFAAATCGVIGTLRSALILLIVTLGLYSAVALGPARSPYDIPVTLIVAIGTFLGTRLQLALFAKNARLADAQDQIRHLTVAAERERIARDLHDTLGQTLTLIVLRSDLALRRDKDATAALRDDLETIARTARHALSETRQTVSSMRIATLGQELSEAVTALQTSGVSCRIAGDPGHIPAHREGVFAAILREGVTNVIRHARAESCTIAFGSSSAGETTLEIRDQGPEEIQQSISFQEGNGISGMRARITELGGSLTITRHAHGTTLRITLGDFL